MHYADNDGVTIFYKSVGDGPTLVLQHGLAGTHLDWIKFTNYVDALSDKYRLILLDSRGRGKSDKPYTPEEHSLKHMVEDITAILDALNIEQAHFLGYSMGGAVGLAAGVYDPDRFKSLIIGGAGLIEKSSKKSIDKYHDFIREYEQRIPIYDQGVDAATAYLKETRGDDVGDYTIERWLNADPRALIAYCSNYENIGMADILPTLTLPCLLYAGEKDVIPHAGAKTCAEVMQNATFVSFPGLDHVGAFTNIDEVLPHVLKFLNDIQ